MSARIPIPGRTAPPLRASLLGASLLLAGAASAQITVIGEGRAETAPDAAVIIITVSGEAERADDAVVRYTDKRQQIDAAVTDGDWSELEAQALGLSVAYAMDPQQAMMFDGDPGELTPDVRASEDIALVWSYPADAEEDVVLTRLTELTSQVEDFGATLIPASTINPYMYQQNGNQPLFAFALTDSAGLRREATAAAVADARAQADELAALAGLRVTGVESIGREATHTELTMYPWMEANDPAARYREALGPNALLAESSSRVESVVRLQITFSVEPAGE